MTSIHREKHFEDEICQHLAAHGWHYDATDAQHYDRALALYPADLVAWVQRSQPDTWHELEAKHGARAGAYVCEQVRTQLNRSTTVDVIRHGITIVGLRHAVRLAQF